MSASLQLMIRRCEGWLALVWVTCEIGSVDKNLRVMICGVVANARVEWRIKEAP